MKYKDFYTYLLTEAIEQLFHLTNVNSFNSMLQENRILLSSVGGSKTGTDMNHNKFFYLSTSREKYSGYGRGISSHKYVAYPVNIVINGKAVENTRGMKLKSVDYWGKELGSLRLNSNETEERILSDEHQLSPLDKYILEVHIHCPEEINGYMKKSYSDLVEQLKKYQFKSYFYLGDSNQAKEAYKMHAKKYSMSLDDFAMAFQNKFNTVDSEDHRKYGNERDSQKIQTLIDISIHPEKYIDYQKTDKETERIIDTISGMDHDSFLVNLNKNAVRDDLYKLSKEVKRNGYTDYNKFIADIGEKIRKLRGINGDIYYYNKQKDFDSFVKNISYRVKADRNNINKLSDILKSKLLDTGEYPNSEEAVMDIYNLKLK